MADRVSLSDFINNYESKNGEMGSEEVLNRAVHEVKIELDRLWNWSTGDSNLTLPAGDIKDSFINDSISYTDPNATNFVRSANYSGLRISNNASNNNSTSDTWCTHRIYQQIHDAVVDGGTW
jgi:hypothetical protein